MSRDSAHRALEQHIDDACRRAVRIREREIAASLLSFCAANRLDPFPFLQALRLEYWEPVRTNGKGLSR